jgi:hypothetical protein
MRNSRQRMHLIAVLTALTLTAAAALAVPAVAACGGTTTPSAVASALHQGSAAEIPLLTPPGPAWSVETDCTIVAWTGTRPVSKAQLEAAMAAGTYAVVRIATWVPAPGLSFAGAQLKGFRETLASIASQARLQIVKGLHGRTFDPLRHGASAKGWKGAGKTFREARGAWSKRASLRIISISVREQRKASVTGALARIAGSAVPAFGL